MIKRQALVPLGVLLVICFIGSGVLKDEESGLLGVLSNIAWFGFLLLALFFIGVAVATIARNRRRLLGSERRSS